MSKILCIIDGMTDPAFCAADYRHLSRMRKSHDEDTSGHYEPETLTCVLRLLGVFDPPAHLRGYVEALGAGIPVQADDLILRGSWFARDTQGYCTVPCPAPAEIKDPAARYHSLGQYKALLVYPHMAHMVHSVVTRIPSGCAGQVAESFAPLGSAALRYTFEQNLTQSRCMILWGQSTAACLPPFPQRAAVICGKDIVKGIARMLRMDLMTVSGVTGDVDTDLAAKTVAALAAAETYPFVLLHINGADEASHRRDPKEKRRFLQQVDELVLSRLLQSEHTICVVSDHGTDPQTGRHLGEPQPVFLKQDDE